MSIEYSDQLAPTAHAYDVQTFLDAWTAEPRSLDLRPPFQRNMVWNDDQRSYLVDSILRGLPVPELYLQKSTSPDGDQRIVVVDGQQRISACIDFVLGKFKLSTSNTELDERWRDKKFEELVPELRARFRNFGFVGRQLPASLNEASLREIFQRLNRTVEALEPQELRHAAYTGVFIQLIEAAGQTTGLQELSVFSAKDLQRRRNDEFVSEVFYAVLLGVYPNKKEGLDEQYMVFERQGLPEDRRVELTARFGRANELLSVYGARIKRTRFRNKSDAYTLLVYLMNHADRVPTSDPDVQPMIEAIERFSSLVNEIKKRENAGDEIGDLANAADFDQASRYLRSVERAASDRQNRVRRADALGEVLEPILDGLPLRPLSSGDANWLTDLRNADLDEESPESVEEELDSVRRVLADEEED